MKSTPFVVSYGQILDLVYDKLGQDSFYLDTLSLAVIGRSFFKECPPVHEPKAKAFNRKMDSLSPMFTLRVYNTLCFILLNHYRKLPNHF